MSAFSQGTSGCSNEGSLCAPWLVSGDVDESDNECGRKRIRSARAVGSQGIAPAASVAAGSSCNSFSLLPSDAEAKVERVQ